MDEIPQPSSWVVDGGPAYYVQAQLNFYLVAVHTWNVRTLSWEVVCAGPTCADTLLLRVPVLARGRSEGYRCWGQIRGDLGESWRRLGAVPGQGTVRTECTECTDCTD